MSSQSYSYSSYSSTSTSNGQSTGQAFTQTQRSDGSGTTVTTRQQDLGGPVVEETRSFDPQGRELIGNSQGGSDRRIEDVSAAERQAENDRLYEERIEDEYAKREGGA